MEMKLWQKFDDVELLRSSKIKTFCRIKTFFRIKPFSRITTFNSNTVTGLSSAIVGEPFMNILFRWESRRQRKRGF